MDINSQMFWVKYNKDITNHTEVYQSDTPNVTNTTHSWTPEIFIGPEQNRGRGLMVLSNIRGYQGLLNGTKSLPPCQDFTQEGTSRVICEPVALLHPELPWVVDMSRGYHTTYFETESSILFPGDEAPRLNVSEHVLTCLMGHCFHLLFLCSFSLQVVILFTFYNPNYTHKQLQFLLWTPQQMSN